ncbi:cilia- and flagella-associated protein 74-like [Tachypleus tridentatus]|uniref:cilia- and flagella-associated protein 74-like n=1 Tax=Tachypleus tridentatus TaxID=6853 RepID=UPI003FD34718
MKRRQFYLKCTGKGVQLPLVISSPVVHFLPTPMNHYHNVTIHLRKPSLSEKPINMTENPVLFEIVIPEDAPITISPLVGTVEEGKTKQEIEDSSQLHEVKPVKPEVIVVGSSICSLCLVSLLKNVKPIVRKYTVPCFITHEHLLLLRKPMYKLKTKLLFLLR